MVAFYISTNPQHHSMPVTADFGITKEQYAHRPEMYQPQRETEQDRNTVEGWDERTWTMMHNEAKRRAFLKEELDPIVNKITDTVPKEEWYGVRQWSRAMHGIG